MTTPNPILSGWISHYNQPASAEAAASWADDIRTEDGYGWDEALETAATPQQVAEALASLDFMASLPEGVTA